MTHTLLEQGIGAALNGRRDEARAILTQIVYTDAHNEQAWLWLAGLVNDPDDMRTCLENVIHLNPDNVKAREGLTWVEQRYGSGAPAAGPGTPPAASTPLPEPQSKEALTALLAETPRVVRPAEPPAPDPLKDAPTPVEEQTTAIQRHVPLEKAAAANQPPPTFPCLYCGAPATLEQHSCPKCHNSLVIRAAPRAKRSAPLTILGILWMLSGVLQLLSGLAPAVLGLIAYVTIQSQLQRIHRSGLPFPTQLLAPLAAGLVIGGTMLVIGRGLLKRQRWAYFIVLGLTIVSLLGTVAMVVLGAAALPKIAQALNNAAASPRAANAGLAAGALMTILAVSAGIQVLYALLVGLSFRDFFGPMVRFQPELDDGSDLDNYNSGVAYKRRGMWYMAAQEWEAAVKKKPRDPGYLHALGLAYVQLKMSYPQATQYHQGLKDSVLSRIDEILAVAPELERRDLL